MQRFPRQRGAKFAELKQMELFALEIIAARSMAGVGVLQHTVGQDAKVGRVNRTETTEQTS